MKIASPCQVDVCNGLKLPAIKVKLSEKLLPGYVWNKENLELPHLITKHLDRENYLQREGPVTCYPLKIGEVLSEICSFFPQGGSEKKEGVNIKA